VWLFFHRFCFCCFTCICCLLEWRNSLNLSSGYSNTTVNIQELCIAYRSKIFHYFCCS
jgi:hypothetical protein